MGSILAEVLSSVDTVEIQNINVKCPEVAIAVENCKREVLSYLENIYVRFTERPRKNKILAKKVSELEGDITNLKNSVEQITRKKLEKTECEVEKHLESLKRLNFEIALVSSVYTIHEAICKIQKLKEDQSFLECMKEVKSVEEFIDGLDFDENLTVVRQLKLEVCTEKNFLLGILSNLFKDYVKLQPETNKNLLKVFNDSDQLKEVLSAFYFYKNSIEPLDNVTRFLWNHVFVPVVDYTTEIKINTENDFAVLEVITVDPNKKSSYFEVFSNIKTILEFLLNNFEFDLSEDLSTLSYIGRDIRDNLSELIIKRCLQDTIPSTKQGLKEYKDVIEATEDLEKSLLEAKIFAEDTTSILEYANNIDVLFINKKCQDYVIEAQDLMKKDLHDLVEVGKTQDATIDLEPTLDFPRCSVSRSVIELLKLLEKMLDEAITSSDICAGRVFCTVLKICQSYVTFVPEHHKKLLQTIPQQIALFYNNCMYIAHKLSEWNDSHLTKLPSLLKINSSNFCEESYQLRQIASEKFAFYIDSQIKQIEEIMKDSGLTQKQTLEQVDSPTEKCLRQCLRQQELLKTVWHKVLPYTVYNKRLGEILNSLCNYLINAIVKFEDISSDAAEQLVELFKMVQTRGPKLFTDPKEVTLFVPSWYKMNELAFVLNASLLDINDRWADGKGPLGLQFKAVELKQLIRALFQNTERRAALLERIHD